MTELNRWSPVAAENNASPPEGAPEGWTGSQVNDVVREALAKIYRWYELPEWLEITYRLTPAGVKTLTQLSTSSFRIVGCDARVTASGHPGFVANRRVRVVQGSNSVYGWVTSAVFSAGNTDVTLDMDDASVVPATIDAVYVHAGGALSRIAFPTEGGILSDLAFLDDESGNGTDQDANASPGDFASRSLPVNMVGELHRLRYQLARALIGLPGSVKRNAGAANSGWIERPARATDNRLLGGRFALADSVASPNTGVYGWTKAGAPTTYETLFRPTASGFGRELHVVAGGASQGASQTVAGLRADTRYLLRVRARVVSGTLNVTTTGGSGSTWGNASHAVTSATDLDVASVILTDGTPTAIVVNLLSAGAAEFFVSEVDLIPLDDMLRAVGDGARYTTQALKVGSQTITAAAGFTVLTSTETDVLAIPGPGHEIVVDVDCCAVGAANNPRTLELRLEESVNGGAYAAVRTSYLGSSNTAMGGSASFRYLRANPAAGSTYRYRLTAAANGNDFVVNGTPAAVSGETAVTAEVRRRAA